MEQGTKSDHLDGLWSAVKGDSRITALAGDEESSLEDGGLGLAVWVSSFEWESHVLPQSGDSHRSPKFRVLWTAVKAIAHHRFGGR